MTVSPAPPRPGALATWTSCVSLDLRHASCALRFPSFFVKANSVGAVASYLKDSAPGAVLPALSEQDPLTVAEALSGPAYWTAGEHATTPEVTSVALNPTVSARLYQPFTSAPRLGVTVTAGAVLSILTQTLAALSPPSLEAAHVTFVPGVSVEYVVVPQPLMFRMTDSGSETDHPRVTLPRYQPVAGGDGEYTGVITGGVGSPGVPLALGARSSVTATALTLTRRSNLGFPPTQAPCCQAAACPEATPSLGTCQSVARPAAYQRKVSATPFSSWIS